jgi:cold shock CspA family protein
LGYGEGMSGGEPLEYDVEQTDEGLSALNVTRLAP